MCVLLVDVFVCSYIQVKTAMLSPMSSKAILTLKFLIMESISFTVLPNWLFPVILLLFPYNKAPKEEAGFILVNPKQHMQK